ncbi:hypothetical protein QTP88_025831 [Uroleucon formosanum]
MTPFGILLVTALFSTQVIQGIAQPKKYRCASFRPLLQPESEPISSFLLRLPPPSITKSSSTVSKYPGSVSKSSSSVINSSSSVPKSPSSVPKSSSSASKSSSSVSKLSSSDSKSSSTVQKVTSTVTNSSANRLPPDSFSLFKLPLKLISSLLVPLIPPIVRQNTSSVFSPLFSFQMPLTFSTIHHSSYLPCNTNNSTAVPCNSIPGNTNNLPINFNPSPGISNNLPISFNSLPGNTNNLPIPFTSIPSNINTLPTPCNSLPGNTNTLPTPCNSLPGNKNNSTSPCNSVSGSTKTLPNPCNSVAEKANNSNNVLCNSLLGNSHKFIIYNWFCNYLLNKIQNVSGNIPPIELIPTPNEPNYPLTTDNPTVTPIPSDFTVIPTEDIPNDNNTPNDNTPNDNTPNDNTPNDNTPNDNTPNDNTSNDNIPISTPQYPIPPCMFTPINKIHTPCLPLIHIPKPKPCSVPMTYSHSHVPLKYCPPNHGSYSPSYAYFNSLFNPTTYRFNADHNLNPQEEILLKILKSVILNPNLRSPSISK